MSAHFGEISVGSEHVSHARTVTEADLVAFTSLAGLKLPIFIDEEFARTQSPFGGRIVPGLLTCAIVGGLMESVMGSSIVAALGLDEVRFLRPVQPGDTIHARFHVDEKRELADGARGLIGLTVRAFNQSGVQVLYFRTKMVMSREPPPSCLPEPVIDL